MKKILVIDGNSILNRAFYGIRLLTNKEGLYTNAIYGMITMVSRHMEAVKPDYCAVAFDLKAPTFRHKMYDGYKANRTGMPEELAVQLPYAKECMAAMGIAVLSKEGYEADDILGTLALTANEAGVDACVLTGDRDSLQLIGAHTGVLLAKTKETVWFDEAQFRSVYGVESSQFVDVKALMGDSSDNIPGVPGIGEKTALKLISEFGSLERLYETYPESSLSASLKQKLADGHDKALLSQTLARIDCHVPLDTSLADYAYHGVDREALRALFVRLEFGALLKKFGLDGEDAGTAGNEEEREIALRKLPDDAPEALSCFRDKTVAVACENGRVFLCDGTALWSVPEDRLAVAAQALGGSGIVCFDYKDLCKLFRRHGAEAPACALDCMLAAYVLDSNRSPKSPEELYLRYLEKQAPSCESPAAWLLTLSEELRRKIVETGGEKLLYEIEIPLSRVLAEMEETGFRIDTAGIRQYGERLAQTAAELEQRIFSYAGEEFNIASPKQLGEILFEKMGLPKPKKTKTGYSTDAETLQKLAAHHPIIEDILDYRQMTKLKSTYADGLVKAADGEGRVHSVFNQTGTATGRLSSSEPNLQNIPVRTEAGREFRKYFIPKDPDHVLIDADYSQIELRLLAHISDDDTMIHAYREGVDIHRTTAAKVFGVAPEDVTPELRKKAKAVNFGIIYGIGDFSLAQDLGISRVQAKKYIDSYLAGFPKVSEYLVGIREKARQDGYVTTYFGRRRYIPELFSSNKNLQHFGERVAMNSPIQGTAADIIKIAMIRVDRELKERGLDARLILQVHDELLVEADRSCAEEALKILVDGMEGAVQLSVPLEVDAHVGDTWFDAK